MRPVARIRSVLRHPRVRALATIDSGFPDLLLRIAGAMAQVPESNEVNTRLRIKGPSGEVHVLLLSVELGACDIAVKVQYESGDLQFSQGTTVADWRADFEGPLPGLDEGQLDIGQGRLDILVKELRGIGLGSYLMSLVICWVHARPNVPVSTIFLSADDATSAASRLHRNRFWEKLGFRFHYHDGGRWGESKAMLSHDLVDPGMKLAEGWEIEEL